jgi:hypothetical protein
MTNPVADDVRRRHPRDKLFAAGYLRADFTARRAITLVLRLI